MNRKMAMWLGALVGAARGCSRDEKTLLVGDAGVWMFAALSAVAAGDGDMRKILLRYERAAYSVDERDPMCSKILRDVRFLPKGGGVRENMGDIGANRLLLRHLSYQFSEREEDEIAKEVYGDALWTHSKRCAKFAESFFRLLRALAEGRQKSEIRRRFLLRCDSYPMRDAMIKVLMNRGQDDRLPRCDIQRCFTSAFSAFYHHETFESGLTYVCEQGGETEINAAVYGALMGAYLGDFRVFRKDIELLYENQGNERRNFSLRACLAHALKLSAYPLPRREILSETVE